MDDCERELQQYWRMDILYIGEVRTSVIDYVVNEKASKAIKVVKKRNRTESDHTT